jgi:iron(III) transport system permease protein
VTRSLLRDSAWTGAALVLAALVLLPLGAVVLNLFPLRLDVWGHLASTILPEVAWNTIVLVTGVAVLSGVLGTGLAWLIAVHDFPGRRIFDWALVLPLAIPAYVLAFVYIGLFDFTGPIQSLVTAWFGPGVFLPDIRSMPGLIVVMSLVLYPYPYLLARTAFADLGASLVEGARSLGHTPRQAFFRVALPMARPAVVAGVALAAMETIADFGAVALFDVRTFTVAIYRVWYGMFDRQAAGQLAVLLLVAALVILAVERTMRRRARYVQAHGRSAQTVLERLSPARGALAAALASAVLVVSFLLPVAVLVHWSYTAGWTLTAARFPSLLGHSLTLAAIAAFVTLGAALLLATGRRLHRGRGFQALAVLPSLGYALPGSVVAVGVLFVVSPIDHALTGWLEGVLGRPLGLVLTGSAIALLFAYVVRFIAVALSSIDAGFEQISPSLDDASRALGAGPARMFGTVHVPLLRGAIITAFLLVAVDVLKELPATMLIRPFGWDTLAIEVWQRTTESLWHEAALPALSIAAAGMLPVVALTRLRGRAARPPVSRRRQALKGEEAVPVTDGALLRLEGVTRRFSPGAPPAVDNVTFDVRKGEILALVGPSGCGKTTTLRMIAGFDAPESGRITIGTRLVADGGRTVPPEQRAVGVVFQEGALFPHLTVADNVAFGLRRLPAAQRTARLAEVLRLCELDGLGERYPHELSGGQQQRCAVARALAPGNELVLLDEPFSNADPDLRASLRAEIRRILAAAHVTAIVVTHDRDDAFELADRMAVMRAGRIEQIGTPREVHAAPATAFVARFVGNAAPLPGRCAELGCVLTEVGVLPCHALPHAPDACAEDCVEVMLRPEQVRISTGGEGAAGTVVACRFRGDRTIATVELRSGIRLTGIVEAADIPRAGDTVSINVRQEPVTAFPTDRSGRTPV